MFYKSRIYLPDNSDSIPIILQEIHSMGHEGFYKTMQRLHAVFYWKRMVAMLKELIQKCDICQQHKTDHQTPAGLLQPLSIPNQVWTDISMDFIEGLPPLQGKSVLFVVVDRLTKYAHFIPLTHLYTAPKVAQSFFERVFKLHGMPRSIVCDRDPVCVSTFWRELFNLQGTNFNFSCSYHPQTNGQTEAINRTVEMYLHCFTSSKPKEWTKWVPWVEFYYNTSIHSSTK